MRLQAPLLGAVMELGLKGDSALPCADSSLVEPTLSARGQLLPA